MKPNQIDWSVEALGCQNGCSSGKKILANGKAARIAQARIQRRRKVNIDIYPCPLCGGLHVGNSVPSRRGDNGNGYHIRQ